MDQLESLAVAGKINEEASVKDKQSIVINAPIQKVWDTITAVKNWPEWNRRVSRVKLLDDNNFEWTLNGHVLKSKITLQQAPHSFSWVSRTSMLKIVQLYKLDKVNENETSLILEGSMQGFKTLYKFTHQKVHKSFVDWLDDLKALFSKD